jgi:hypothetical protein
MPRTAAIALIGLVSLLASLAGGRLRAQQASPDDVLKKFGLKHVGSLYVLASEEEAVKHRLSELRITSKDLKQAEQRQATTPSAKDQQAMIQNMTSELNQIKSQVSAVNQQMNRIPRYRGRNRMANFYYNQQRAELMAYRNQLNAAVSQQNALINQAKTHPPDPKAKAQADAEVVDRRDRYEQAVRNLGESVNATRAKYDELAANPEVKTALSRLEKKSRFRSNLGPSHEFRETLKLVQKLQNEKPTPPAGVSDPIKSRTRKNKPSSARPF